MSSRAKAYLYLLGAAFFWGIALPLIKPVFQYINAFQFLYFRYLLASILILPALIYTLHKYRPKVKDLIKISALELIQILGLILLYLGLEKTSAIEASILGASDPVFVTLGAIIFLKERENKKEWQGLIISFLATLTLVFKPLHSVSFIGNLLILLYLLTITAYYLLAKRYYAHYSKIMVTAISYPLALLVTFSFNRYLNFPVNWQILAQPIVLLICLYMAIFGSLIAFTFYLKGQALIEASEASLFTYLHIVFALPAAYLIDREIISPLQIILILTIAYGVFLAEKRV